MRVGQTVQPVSYELRLPDAVQAAALRLLDASREVINATVAALWERLDDFGERETKYAYKQVTALIGSSDPHGDRQWRCEAEQAGRILRGQARRKQHFSQILPLLEQGMILPKGERARAGKNRTAIKAALACLRDEHSDGGSAVELQSLIEQACNFYLSHGCFPETYEDMQAVPLLKVGILPYAADDGGLAGQAYRLRMDAAGRSCYLAFRSPDEQGVWKASWTEPQIRLPLPDPVVQRLQAGERLAPTLREVAEPDGTRYAVLDLNIEVPVAPLPDPQQVQRVLGWDWGVRTLVTATVLDLSGNRLSPPLFLDTGGFDGRQAHTRRHIDRLKSKVATLSARGDQFAVGDKRREPSERKLVILRREIARCWRKYEARNNDLAHLAANMLILLASVWGADLIAGESLKSMKSEGRGRGAKGRWVHWRKNSQIRGALWKWLRCYVCGWNGARDYAAAINIALLGVASLVQDMAHTVQRNPPKRPTMITKNLNSESYTGSGLALRLPPTPLRGCLERGKLFVNGWSKSVTLHSALSQETMLRLCG